MGSSDLTNVVIDLVPVGNPGNENDIPAVRGGPAFGSVATGYQIGKYDVTAQQYCSFLNAVAKKDLHHLYDTNMQEDPNIASITRSGEVDNYSYEVIPGRERLPITYVRWFAAIRFCNWLENGRPTGEQSPETTECGSFTNNEGHWEAVPGAKWSLPTESQWYKAAYYNPPSSSNSLGFYSAFGTSSLEIPGNKLEEAAFSNRANYARNSIYTQEGPLYLTPVGTFTASASPCGAYDMAENVDQWTTAVSGQGIIVRGGSWASQSSEDLKFSSAGAVDPSLGTSTIGFRLVYNVEPFQPEVMPVKIPRVTVINSIIKDGTSVGSALSTDLKNIPNIFQNPTSVIYNAFNYMIGGSIGEFMKWILNMGIQTIDRFFTFLGGLVRSFLGEGSMEWFDGWVKTIYSLLFSPVDRSVQLEAAKLAARGASGAETVASLSSWMAQNNLNSVARAANVTMASNTGIATSETAVVVGNPALAGVADAFATNFVADNALASAGTCALSAEAAVMAETALASFFTSPAAAVMIPMLVLWGGAEMIHNHADPRYGSGLTAVGCWFGYNALRLL